MKKTPYVAAWYFLAPLVQNIQDKSIAHILSSPSVTYFPLLQRRTTDIQYVMYVRLSDSLFSSCTVTQPKQEHK